MNASEKWSLLVEGIALAIPATFALAAILPRGPSPRRITAASGLALGLSALFGMLAHRTGHPSPGASTLGVQVDTVTTVMLLLVCGIGFFIVRYSRTYLRGEAELPRYFRWLSLTLCAVTSLVVAGDLLTMAVAWTATSLALHQLLTFYADRTAALIAAHKKFLVSRIADACLLGCLALVHADVGSVDLDRIAAWATAHPALSPSMHAAAVLLVAAVALKSAQLPFHGWLTQVMEAPTPVSALLHAGIVNIGGFVLIRLAPWLAHAHVAQFLLVVVGLVSAIVGALVMTTRVSVKVALAWSTCAQIGFMLVQCGLGAWNLALLHLVAHSVYKAHAFLGTGTTVDGWRLATATEPRSKPTWSRLGIGTLVVLASATFAVVIVRDWIGIPQTEQPTLFVLAGLVGLSMVPMVVGTGRGGVASALVLAGNAIGVVLLYVGWHAAAEHLLPGRTTAANPLALALVATGFAALFAVKAALEVRPDGRLARALHPWLFAGLYLDERFTRLTFRVFPPRLPPSETTLALPVATTLEA